MNASTPARRQGDQRVRKQRVGRFGDLLEVEDQTSCQPHLARTGKELFDRNLPAPLGAHILGKRIPFRRNRRVEKKGAVDNLHRRALPCLQRPLQVPLTDAAEGSNRVVEDLDLHACTPFVTAPAAPRRGMPSFGQNLAGRSIIPIGLYNQNQQIRVAGFAVPGKDTG